MSHESNTQKVCRWFQEMWNERRLETIDKLLTDDVISHEMIGPGVSVQGKAQFRAVAEQLLSAFGEIHFTVQDVFGQDDRVAIRLTVRLKHTGPLGDLPATGKSLTLPVMCMVRMRDGLLAEGWNSWDISAVLRTAAAPAERNALF